METPASGSIVSFLLLFFSVKRVFLKINYTEERGVFENDEGHGLFF
jgi:hypothetical protein